MSGSMATSSVTLPAPEPGGFPGLLPLPPPLPTSILHLVVLVPEASLRTSQRLPSSSTVDPDPRTIVSAPVTVPDQNLPRALHTAAGTARDTCERGRASTCLTPSGGSACPARAVGPPLLQCHPLPLGLSSITATAHSQGHSVEFLSLPVPVSLTAKISLCPQGPAWPLPGQPGPPSAPSFVDQVNACHPSVRADAVPTPTLTVL